MKSKTALATRLWGASHCSLIAITASLSAAGCATIEEPEPTTYETCEPVAPATDCGDDVDIEVK